MNIEIRLLTDTDVKAYRDLRLKSFKNAPLAFSESYEDEIQRPIADFKDELEIIGTPPEHFLLGAFTPEGILVGFVKFRRDSRSKARHKSMIHAMYTDINYRQMGIGKILISKILERAKSMNGLEQIHLWVLHATDSAAGFYRSCGFMSQGTLVKKDLKIGEVYVDAEYMVKYLNQE